MYVNCGVKNYSELRSSRLYTQLLQSVCSYEKKNFIIILSRVYNEFLSGFLFATAKVAYITAMIFIHYTPISLSAILDCAPHQSEAGRACRHLKGCIYKSFEWRYHIQIWQTIIVL